MNPYTRIKAVCFICNKTEENIRKVLIKEGWKLNGTQTRCKECAKETK